MRRWTWIRHAPVVPQPVAGFYGMTDIDADVSKVIPLPVQDAYVICSPLKRSLQTAQALGLEPDFVTPAIAEQNFGVLEGQPYPDKDHAFWESPADYRPDGGESFADVCARVSAFQQSMTAKNIICIAHAGSMRAALASALGLAPESALSFEIKNLHKIVMTRHEGGWTIHAVNIPLV